MDKWRACKDLLPDSAGFYLVTKRQKSGETQIAIGHWSGKEWSGNGRFTDVRAWMPLPEKYVDPAQATWFGAL